MVAREPEKIVLVGHGMVGHRFCERLDELDEAGRYRVTILAEEIRPAYDRVHLSEFFSGKSAEDLALVDEAWFEARGIELKLGARADAIDTQARQVRTSTGETLDFDHLVLATGSAPFVPPIPGTDLPGVFVYRTIEDLEAIRSWAERSRRAAVIGGGLLGLEAAKALHDMGLETHVVEFAERLMPRQVDAAGGRTLRESIEALGVQVHLERRTECVVGDASIEALRFAGHPDLELDMVVISAGIRPRDELARETGLELGERGGICVDDGLATSGHHIYAIGECALHRGAIYGLVAPGYEMADVLARRLVGEECGFAGADLSTKLKLLGVDVASFGDAFADAAEGSAVRPVVFEDHVRGVYQKVLIDPESQHIVGGVLVGDAEPYAILADAARRKLALPERIESWLFQSVVGEGGGACELDDEGQICSCNNVTVGSVRKAIEERELTSLEAVKTCTRVGTGCGGCVPLVSRILDEELARAGREVSRNLCEHFSQSREELYWIVKLGRIESFDALIESHGQGDGCEICRPAVASILASTWNDLVVDHHAVQDTNDRLQLLGDSSGTGR